MYKRILKKNYKQLSSFFELNSKGEIRLSLPEKEALRQKQIEQYKHKIKLVNSEKELSSDKRIKFLDFLLGNYKSRLTKLEKNVLSDKTVEINFESDGRFVEDSLFHIYAVHSFFENSGTEFTSIDDFNKVISEIGKCFLEETKLYILNKQHDVPSFALIYPNNSKKKELEHCLKSKFSKPYNSSRENVLYSYDNKVLFSNGLFHLKLHF